MNPIFDSSKLLGRGAFGKVYLVRLAKSPNLYALKQIKKKFIVRKFQVENLMCNPHVFLTFR
jgi:serine/threonine protein kinase